MGKPTEAPRAIVEKPAGELRITIPARPRSVASLLWDLLFFIGMGVLMAIQTPAERQNPIWWAAVMVAIGIRIFLLLPGPEGREVLAVEGPLLVHQRKLKRIGPTRTFDCARVRSPRLVSRSATQRFPRIGFRFGGNAAGINVGGSRSQDAPYRGPTIAFDYDKDVYEVCSDVSEEEAAFLLKELVQALRRPLDP
jgi:hypothetical protein